MSRYEQLAEQLRQQIQSQIWQAGDKLPSLRKSCQTSGLSLMTVLQAYQLLESQGWIVARPQSGYYVASQVHPLPEPVAGKKMLLTERVDINTFIFEVLKANNDPLIIPFGSAFPDPELFPLPQLARALASAARKMPPHSAVSNLPPGNESLRRCIAQRYLQRGITAHPDEIVITAGAMEALILSLQAVTQPGDWVIVESPAFYGVLQAIERLGLKAISIEVHPQSGIDIPAVEQALNTFPVKACCLMSHFHHPLGCSLSPEHQQMLMALLTRHRVTIIEDDTYTELYYGQKKTLPLKALDSQGQVLHCSSFSKCLAPGYRVGWVLAGSQAERIQHLQLMSSIAVSVPTQLAFASYLQRGGYDTHLRRLRRVLEQRLNAMRQAISHSFPAGTKISQPLGGYFLWVELSEAVSATELYQLALYRGISIAPGKMFSLSDRYENGFRLNASYAWDERAQAAIQTLGLLAHELHDSGEFDEEIEEETH